MIPSAAPSAIGSRTASATTGAAEASFSQGRPAASASSAEPSPSHRPRFSQPGAGARKKSGPMLSYTRAVGYRLVPRAWDSRVTRSLAPVLAKTDLR
jgi:hypothetical protein